MPIDTGTIYDQILKLRLDLDFEDIPTPAYLQEKILECSNAMRTIEKRIIEVTREFSIKERDLKLEQMRLEVKKRGLLVNDPVIKKIPTGKEREAAADEKLQADHERVLALENDVIELQNLLSSVRLVHQNLKTTNSDIRVLMRIMEQQIFKLNVGSRTDKEVSGLMAGLSEVEQLEDELTPDDVASSSEGIDLDKPDGLSEEATQIKTDPAPEEVGSESGDEVDSMASFLTDDPEEMGDQETTPAGDGEENDVGPAQSAVGKEVAKTKNSDPSTTEAAVKGGGGSVVTGLEIDLGDVLDEPHAPSAAPPVAKSEGSPSDVKSGKVIIEKKEEAKPKAAVVAPVDKPPPKKGPEEAELDIDDILNSLN
jgi:hypothetical protein